MKYLIQYETTCLIAVRILVLSLYEIEKSKDEKIAAAHSGAEVLVCEEIFNYHFQPYYFLLGDHLNQQARVQNPQNWLLLDQ